MRLRPIIRGRQGGCLVQGTGLQHSPIISSSLTRQSRHGFFGSPKLIYATTEGLLPRHDLDAVTSLTWHVARGNETDVPSPSILLFSYVFLRSPRRALCWPHDPSHWRRRAAGGGLPRDTSPPFRWSSRVGWRHASRIAAPAAPERTRTSVPLLSALRVRAALNASFCWSKGRASGLDPDPSAFSRGWQCLEFRFSGGSLNSPSAWRRTPISTPWRSRPALPYSYKCPLTHCRTFQSLLATFLDRSRLDHLGLLDCGLEALQLGLLTVLGRGAAPEGMK